MGNYYVGAVSWTPPGSEHAFHQAALRMEGDVEEIAARLIHWEFPKHAKRLRGLEERTRIRFIIDGVELVLVKRIHEPMIRVSAPAHAKAARVKPRKPKPLEAVPEPATKPRIRIVFAESTKPNQAKPRR